MKATGIVRRIDDLGRVVIPKEIRRTLRIRESDPMEIFTNREGEIILKKYSPMGELDEFATQYAEALAQISGCKIMISDRDQIIASAGGAGRDIIGKSISDGLEKLVLERQIRVADGSLDKGISVTGQDGPIEEGQIVYPILCHGDVIGSVIINGKDEKQRLSQTEEKLAGVAATFLGKQLEN